MLIRSSIGVLLTAFVLLGSAWGQPAVKITGTATFEYEADRGMANVNPGGGKLAFPINTRMQLRKRVLGMYFLDKNFVRMGSGRQ